MAANARQAKVLRIGIIQDGKIVQERLIKAGASVIVGESAKNTFVFPKTHLPKADFPIFQYAGGHYTLVFTEQMRGKISSGGSVVNLAKLRKDPSIQRSGALYELALTEQDRGKIGIDEVTVLFQFVAPPPVQAVKPIQAMDFRPRLLEEDDPVFLGFLAIWSALAVVFMVWVWNTEPTEMTLEEIPDRFTKMVLEEPKKVDPIEIKDDKVKTDKAKSAKVEDVAPEPEPAKAKEKPKNKVEAAKQKAEVKDKVLRESKLLLKIIGTTGESKAGTVENMFDGEDSGFGDIDKKLAEGATGVTTDASEALRGGKGGKSGGADIGELGGVGGGNSELGSGPAVQLEASVAVGEGGFDEDIGDSDGVKKTVRRYSGQLKYCYEQRLKVNPNLEGRVEFAWTVTGGAVSGVYVVANNTGDSEFASCMEGKIKRWRFPDTVEGDISWPFVFRAKK